MAHGNNKRKPKPIPSTWERHTLTKAGKRYTYLGWVKVYHEAERKSHQYGEHQHMRDLIRAYPDHFKQYAAKHQMSESTNPSHYKMLTGGKQQKLPYEREYQAWNTAYLREKQASDRIKMLLDKQHTPPTPAEVKAMKRASDHWTKAHNTAIDKRKALTAVPHLTAAK